MPERDARGNPIALRSVQGATTIELTAQEATLAAKTSGLWIQGGTMAQPVLFDLFPSQYAFGALRCSMDNLNGDNVEWITFAQGARHAFCYAYYVTPPPTSGAIKIVKHVEYPDERDADVQLRGQHLVQRERSVRPARSGTANDASATFYRAATGAGDPPWQFKELTTSPWVLTGLACSPQSDRVTTNLATRSVSIRLNGGETITCTFTNRYAPEAGQLLISKVTEGDTGTFGFDVRNPADALVTQASATTTQVDVAKSATFAGQSAPGPKKLDPGTYYVSERQPEDTRAGSWRRVEASCDPRESLAQRRAGRSLLPPEKVTVTATRGAACSFRNRFVPAGAITIEKQTRGGFGTTAFEVASLEDTDREYRKTAVTREAGEVVTAQPAEGSRPTQHLPLGRYAIQEMSTMSDEDGRWVLEMVDCGAGPVPFEQGRVEVTLTRDKPEITCRFINDFTPDVPPVPPTPQPSPPGELPDLVVEKRALQRSVRFGSLAGFELTVRNAGPVAAEHVVLAEAPGKAAQLATARPSAGICRERTLAICRLGRLGPGEEITIRVRVRAVGSPTLRNLAVAGSASEESRLDNNAARARVRVRSRGGVLGGLCIRPAQLARMAC